MVENATAARPYATAVFELAQETGRIAQWADALALLSLITSDPALRRLSASPKVSRAQLQELVFEIGGDALSGLSRNLVKTLIQAGRLQCAPDIRALFERMRAAAEGKIEAQAMAAYELDQGQQDAIAAALAARLGKRVELSASVDESLIGGVVIRAGDLVIDASLQGRLAGLRNQLA